MKTAFVSLSLLGLLAGSTGAAGASPATANQAGAVSPAAPASAVRSRRFALLAGVNDGGPTRVHLRYAASDAEAMARVLESLGGVAESDLVFVRDASRAAFEAGLAEIGRRLRAGQRPGVRSELLIYYSGHSDDEGLLVGRDRIAYDDLRARIQAAPADLRVVILDSCGSGAFTRRKGGTRRPPFLLDASIDMRGHAFLTSSAASEAAQESDRIAASFFTYFLVSGLRGAADVNQDRRVTLQEAFQFAAQETLARTERSQGGPQHAGYEFDLTGTGDMVVTDVRTTQAGLVLTPELSGRISVRQAGGALVAELRKPAGNTIELGLDPGEYLVVMEGSKNLLEAHLTLGHGQHTQLALVAFAPGAPLEVATARGDQPEADAAIAVPGGAATPGPPHELTSIKLGFFPRGADARTDVDGFSFGFVADRAASLHGFQLTLAYAQVDEWLWGTQLSVGANLDLGDLHGMQAAVGANIVRGDARGAQFASGANVVTGQMRGFQAAASVNVVATEMHGLQAAAGVNLARTGRGAQLAGGVNFAESFSGAQIAPINVAGRSDGLQLGVVNYNENARSLRLGVVNLGGHTDGFALGVVNIARHDDGESFAILNLVGNGIHDVSLFSTDLLLSNLGLKLGGRHLYTLFALGYQPGDDLAPGPEHFVRGDRRWGVGLGVGWRFPLKVGRLAYLELEASNLELRSSLDHWDTAPEIASLRVQAGIRLMQRMTLLVGAGANVAWGIGGRDADLGLGLPESVSRSGGTTVRVYPGFLVGLQI